jgi:predicted dehydrogenase
MNIGRGGSASTVRRRFLDATEGGRGSIWEGALRQLRWGVLSTARIAREKVISGMRKARRCEVLAIASRNASRARVVADQLGIPRSHGSYEDLLSDSDVDAVYIPLPNHLHAEWTIAGARAGKHVLCEKPLALTTKDAQQMVEVCNQEGVKLMEAFMYRLHPSWVAARELVSSGRIGELRAVQSWFSYFNDDRENIRNIHEYGGGAMYDIGCYSVNLSRMLFDDEPLGVEAVVERDPVSGVDVLASAILEFEAGVAELTCSTRLAPDQRVHIYGSKGWISIDFPFNIPPDLPTRILVTGDGESRASAGTEVLEFDPADQYAVQGELFAAAVLDDEPTPLPAYDAVANLSVIERIFAAAGRPRTARGRSR